MTARDRRIVLVEHQDTWAEEFAGEGVRIAGVLGTILLELHHIGSTAIPGIVAKPVIDILAVVTSVDDIDAQHNGLPAIGYEGLGEFGIPGRRYFRKDNTAGIRTHQVHAFVKGSPDVERHLNFRDYLRAHDAEAAEYAALKRELAERFVDDMRGYSEGKTEFIRAVERRAEDWRGKAQTP